MNMYEYLLFIERRSELKLIFYSSKIFKFDITLNISFTQVVSFVWHVVCLHQLVNSLIGSEMELHFGMKICSFCVFHL